MTTTRSSAVLDAPPDPTRVFARRIARIAVGTVLLIGAFALVAKVALEPCCDRAPPPSAGQILGYTWFAAAVVGALTYAFAAALRLRLGPDALFVPSLVVPVAGGTLLLPLTLHLLVALVIGARSESFDSWVGCAVGITGAAHLAFAGMTMRHVQRLARGAPATTPARIFGVTVAVSCFPFAVLYLLPPLVVAITGLPILLLLHAMDGVVARERAEIAALPGTLPRAHALPPRR